MKTSFNIGKHLVRVDEDRYTLTIIGDISEEEAKEINKVQEKYFKSKFFFTLCDVTEMGSVSAAARKAFAGNSGTGGATALAIWGASFKTRVLANLILNAIKLVSKQSMESSFFKTEAEAMAWVDELRKKLN